MAVDWQRRMRPFYEAPTDGFAVVDVPEMDFFMLDGRGDRQRPLFQEAVRTLQAVAQTAKSVVCSVEPARDYALLPVEALFAAPTRAAGRPGPRTEGSWTLMVRQPVMATRELFRNTVSLVRQWHDLPMLDEVRLGTYREGLCVQTMHVGPKGDHRQLLDRMRDWLQQQEMQAEGPAHEVYLDTPTASAPRARTLLRQPVRARRVFNSPVLWQADLPH